MARETGFGVHAAALAAVARECIHIKLEPTAAAELALGASHMGGQPDLPPDREWPRWNGASLAFIAQFELSELARFPAAQALPRVGQLAFFYEVEQQTWGFDPKDRGSFRVIYLPEQRLERRSLPQDLPEHARFTACGARLEPAWSLPPWGSGDFPPIGPYDEQVDELLDGLDQFLSESRSILFGYPGQIQGDMQEECALVTGGIYCGDPSGYEDPRAAPLREQASQWQLLLQVASEEAADMIWGDMGCLYYWMHQADLRRSDFDRAWMILQCG